MEINILPYSPEYNIHFEKLNKAWLEEYFEVEPIDAYVLSNPEEAIIKDGGSILFAAWNEKIIGTVALKFIKPGIFELTKMAVDKPFQGMGAGKLLCIAAIEQARTLHASKLILYSQSSLKAAIGIYYKLGFTPIPLDGKYKRADIKMQLIL
jgi:GNAT superfamily N-acetyltransferase